MRGVCLQAPCSDSLGLLLVEFLLFFSGQVDLFADMVAVHASMCVHKAEGAKIPTVDVEDVIGHLLQTPLAPFAIEVECALELLLPCVGMDLVGTAGLADVTSLDAVIAKLVPLHKFASHSFVPPAPAVVRCV